MFRKLHTFKDILLFLIKNINYVTESLTHIIHKRYATTLDIDTLFFRSYIETREKWESDWWVWMVNDENE